MSLYFYRDLQGFDQFAQLTRSEHYVTAPQDWHILVTDIQGSTRAIAEGRYKEVNLAGAAVVMAVLNITGNVPVPYVFGGDGASMLIPPELVPKASKVLGAICAKVRTMFGLELRAGLIPIAAAYADNTWLKVAKFNLSPHVSQAFFQGTALSLAEKWLKTGGGAVAYCTAEGGAEADLQGLECRWQPIKSRNGKIISLLVKAASDHEPDIRRIYGDMLREIEAIYPDYAHASPAHVQGMHISFSPRALMKEAKIRAGGTLFKRLSYLARILVINAIGQYSFKTGKAVGSFNGPRYLSHMVANSDCRKFDEMLRIVIDSTQAQHDALLAVLEGHRQKREIIYGLHVASEALMTCLVFNLDNNHVHFIDGADGGYAVAALQMKQQLAEGVNVTGSSSSPRPQ